MYIGISVKQRLQSRKSSLRIYLIPNCVIFLFYDVKQIVVRIKHDIFNCFQLHLPSLSYTALRIHRVMSRKKSIFDTDLNVFFTVFFNWIRHFYLAIVYQNKWLKVPLQLQKHPQNINIYHSMFLVNLASYLQYNVVRNMAN